MKGVVAFSLFGDKPLYNHGALKNAQIWRDSPFDVDLVYYCGDTVPESVVTHLVGFGARVVLVDAPENQTATFWRFDALSHAYDYVLFRDVDSRPNNREFTAIAEWLSTGYGFHVMRDHPYHAVPVLAGLWGVKCDAAHIIADVMPMAPPEGFYKKANTIVPNRQWHTNDFYQVDQMWLLSEVYPKMRHGTLAHDEFFSFEKRSRRRRFPARIGLEFVGEGFDEYDQPRFPDHRELIAAWPKPDPSYL